MKLTRKPVVIAISLIVAALHLVTGPDYRGPFRGFVTGYLMNLLLPGTMLLVLDFARHRLLRSRAARGLLVFGVGTITETLQYFDVPIFGRTFDPVDYAMFAISVFGAAVFEITVLSRIPKDGRSGR
jgi:hypothetical protein